jgi:para-aminobenzoate synthetase component 1
LVRQKLQVSFLSQELDSIKRRILHWASQSSILLFLDNNQYQIPKGKYECLLGLGAIRQYKIEDGDFSKLILDQQTNKDWLFGHLNYDFKNQLENLVSHHANYFLFPESYFFCPDIVCYIKREENTLFIESATKCPEEIWKEIQEQIILEGKANEQKIKFEKRIQKEEYLSIIHKLKQHIIDGDCYEINFCNEAFCKEAIIDPLISFERLNLLSKAPFAAYYKINEQFLLCASPERYLRKEGNWILAQPIKGTAARKTNPIEDQQQKDQLLNSLKERAENVMIVDLMRNDLARFCTKGSVNVDELFGIYSYPQVHQMISTISGQLQSNYTPFDVLKLSFPMGSMTGAPKIMVMKLIEQYEKARRGLFSGCVGYISPDEDFDFNVVIRSLFYNKNTQYLSYQTGGAITYDSKPEEEWQETCLKADAIERLFH